MDGMNKSSFSPSSSGDVIIMSCFEPDEEYPTVMLAFKDQADATAIDQLADSVAECHQRYGPHVRFQIYPVKNAFN
jgi:hypothetical protein